MSYVRVTKFKMKSGKVDEAVARMQSMKDKIVGLPGIQQFINCANDDGAGYVISVLESKAVADANVESLAAIWGQFADLLEEMPTPEGFEMRANWS